MGLSLDERQEFYHLPQGSEHLWLSVLRALPSRDNLEGRVAGFQPFLDNPERFGLFADPSHPERLPVGMSLVPVSERQPAARVGVNCAACHVGEFHYRGEKVRVDGAPGLLSMEALNQEAVEVIARTLSDKRQLVDFLVRLAEQLPEPLPGRPEDTLLQAAYPDSDLTPDGSWTARQKLVSEVDWYLRLDEPEPTLDKYVHELSRKQVRTVADAIRLLRGHLVYFTRLGKLRFATYSGPGRVDAFGVARGVLFGPEVAGVLASPVSFPCLWEFQKQRWMHWDGNTNSIMERNIGQALGMGATVNRETYASSVLPRNLARLEVLSRKIPSPRWPEDVFGTLEPARIERGRALFARECESCHGARSLVVPVETVGTDDNRARSFAKKVGEYDYPAALSDLISRVKQRAYARDGITEEESRALDAEVIYWRAPVGYVSRPLDGVWATAPYLHNGSVPTLWDLLLPAAERPKRFPLGHQDYDPARVGYATEVVGAPRFVFDVSMPGNGNGGHEYGTRLTSEQKLDLLEYLKSL